MIDTTLKELIMAILLNNTLAKLSVHNVSTVLLMYPRLTGIFEKIQGFNFGLSTDTSGHIAALILTADAVIRRIH